MKLTTAVLSLLAALPPLAFAAHQKRNYDAHDYYAVQLTPDVRPEDVSTHLGLQYEGPLGHLDDHHVFRTTDRRDTQDLVKSALEHLKLKRRERGASWEPHVLDHIRFSQKQELHKRFPLLKRSVLPQQEPPVDPNAQKGLDIAKSLSIEDPIFQDQWHLYNHVQIGHDINVTGVWAQGITGKNSTVCIVDDGLDMDSDDLRDNYFAAGSYDFNDQVDDPKPRLSDDRHGTRCAGEVAAVRNSVCGVGVAYDANIAGERILSKVISDLDEATAMTYAFESNHIYSCSWGPPDDGRSMEQPGILIRRAMVTGIQRGRDGLGSIYVFAIGNGASNDDNCNFDGYTNSIYSVSVGGIDRNGLHPYYSEACSAQLVVTYSSGSGDAIHTTDVGKDTCVSSHGGTSAAGPLVAGIFALMLQANPALTWRDVQYITVYTAVKVDQPSDWTLNEAVGKEFSHQFGYGKADAWAMVEAAKTWQNVKPQAWFFSPWQHVKLPIPQGDQGLASHFEVTADMLRRANLERLEHVTVTMNVEHTRRGDLSVELHSPSGMVSQIATHRRNDNARAGYEDWTFMSVAHWGESGVGTWAVIVKDTLVNPYSGNFTDWRLRLWGECMDPRIQFLLPLPTENDDDDHDREDASVVTTSVAVPTQTGLPPGNPSDHIDRPINSKVSDTVSAAVPSPTVAPEPVIPPEGDKEEETEAPSTPTPAPTPSSTATSTASPSSTATSASNFLPHPFPSFGVSKHTQIWIYGAITLILIFLACLGGYFYYMRRKKAWMSRDDYGFEMVEGDDHDDRGDGRGAAANANGRTGAGRKKRAGELYDAFAEGSDDEFGLVGDSDEEDEGRHDESEKDAATRYRDDDHLRGSAGVR